MGMRQGGSRPISEESLKAGKNYTEVVNEALRAIESNRDEYMKISSERVRAVLEADYMAIHVYGQDPLMAPGAEVSDNMGGHMVMGSVSEAREMLNAAALSSLSPLIASVENAKAGMRRNEIPTTSHKWAHTLGDFRREVLAPHLERKDELDLAQLSLRFNAAEKARGCVAVRDVAIIGSGEGLTLVGNPVLG